MNDLNLSLKLRKFATGVLVLQVKSQTDEMVIQNTTDLVRSSLWFDGALRWIKLWCNGDATGFLFSLRILGQMTKFVNIFSVV